MKLIALIAVLLSFSTIAAPLKVRVTALGFRPEDFLEPHVVFEAQNPLCTKVILLPMPATYRKTVDLKGTIARSGTAQVTFTVPTSYKADFCAYKFASVSINVKKRLESINLSTSREAAGAAFDELDVFAKSNRFTAFEVDCAKGLCRILKDGSQFGYQNGNVAYLYMNEKTLFKSDAPEVSLTLNVQ